MPELPEVETVRRGLQPVMEGARFAKVEARRHDLRWPLPKDFVARLEGKTIAGLGRRAKYLLADLSSGDVLLMHLGMSGSFRVFAGGSETKQGKYHHERAQHLAHDHVIFHMGNGAVVTFNDPRRFGSMKIVPRAKLDQEPLLRALGPEPLGKVLRQRAAQVRPARLHPDDAGALHHRRQSAPHGFDLGKFGHASLPVHSRRGYATGDWQRGYGDGELIAPRPLPGYGPGE